jgi:calcineurin-like phosphoesterase family protein
VAIFFTSDTHFGDPRVLRIDQRPFVNIAEHDAALIARWNEAVRPDDEVWHLGDFARHARPERIEQLLSQLHGRKHLISGNNDGPDTLSAPGWLSVQPYAEITIDGMGFVLCHYAFRTWKNVKKGNMMWAWMRGITGQSRLIQFLGANAEPLHPLIKYPSLVLKATFALDKSLTSEIVAPWTKPCPLAVRYRPCGV